MRSFKVSASILLMLASTACGERQRQPGIDLCVGRRETLECGSVRVGTLASCSARIRNETGRSIQLQAPHSTCASESVQLEALSLERGASTLLHYKAFAIAPGRVVDELKLVTNAGEPVLELLVVMDVRP
ncbi:MAG: hypothetical protein ACKO4Q_14695 [Planctomycetota bacterium]